MALYDKVCKAGSVPSCAKLMFVSLMADSIVKQFFAEGDI